MPLWSELIVLMVITYGIGIGLGWLVWGNSGSDPAKTHANADAGKSGKGTRH
ncbi:MAG: hypothetical protein ACK5NN_10585 [Sphingomonadaceae bacterium]